MAAFLLFRITTSKMVLPALAAACLSACAVARTGSYSPIGSYLAVEKKLPLSIRTVGVLQAGSKKFGFVPEETFNEGELRRIEVELANAVSNDMLKMGLFRSPRPGEKPYLLDIEFAELTIRQTIEGKLLRIPGGLSLGVAYLLGMPWTVVTHKGEAVFKLYSPNKILVHETVTYGENDHVVGLYYGHTQSFEDIIAILVNKFKTDMFSRLYSIHMNAPVNSIYGNFRRKNPYNLMADKIIMNTGPTQINNVGPSKSTQIEQNSGGKP